MKSVFGFVLNAGSHVFFVLGILNVCHCLGFLRLLQKSLDFRQQLRLHDACRRQHRPAVVFQ